MEDMIKFIHCADIHFDTAFSELPAEKAAVRRDELREVFSRIIELCRSKDADILLISGDLFDGVKVTDETVAFLRDTFVKIPDVQIFISPGNHDPYMPGSKYDQVAFPENVHIFTDDKIKKIRLDSLKLNVYGAAFTSPYLEKSLLDGFSLSKEEPGVEYANILVIHGEIVSSVSQNNCYNPIQTSDIAASGLDYIALGHKHTYFFEKSANTCYAYCGSPEGRGFDETGEKGIIYGEIYKNPLNQTVVKHEFIPCCRRVYKEIKADLTGCATHEEALERINRFIDNPDDIYKIILCGSLKNGFLIDMNILRSRFSDKCFFIKFRNATSTEVDLEALSKETMLKGVFAKRMLLKIEEASKRGDDKNVKLYTDALAFGLKAFEGDVPYDNQIT